MYITVNGKQAVIKKGSKIDYVRENRRFTGADSYTYNITFPLRGCDRNLAIFGHIGRLDVAKNAVRLDARIEAGRLSIEGVLTPTEVTEEYIKCQFLEGRSVQNFATDLDNVFINELDLGRPPFVTIRADLYGGNGQEFHASSDTADCVALPWVNNYSGIMQNQGVASLGSPAAENTTVRISWQPYLIAVAQNVCAAIGYDYDFSAWRSSHYRHLLVCNALPTVWEMPEFAHAMPAWSVTEFFEELEKLMDCEIDISHNLRRVTLTFSRDYYSRYPVVNVDRVINEYTAAVSDKNETEYREAVNVAYSEADHSMQPYYSCPWFVQQYEEQNRVVRYPTLHELMYTETDEARAMHSASLLYAIDVGRHFVWRQVVSNTANNREFLLQEVNQFGPQYNDPATDEMKIELNILPVMIEHAAYKTFAMYLNPGELEDIDENEPDSRTAFAASKAIEHGEPKKRNAQYDKMYVAFWDGHQRLPENRILCPYTDNVFPFSIESTDIFYYTPPYSLKLSRTTASVARIQPETKYTVSFLMDSMPDPRSIFVIHGQRFACARLTATITEKGVSQRIKGEFYRCTD